MTEDTCVTNCKSELWFHFALEGGKLSLSLGGRFRFSRFPATLVLSVAALQRDDLHQRRKRDQKHEGFFHKGDLYSFDFAGSRPVVARPSRARAFNKSVRAL